MSPKVSWVQMCIKSRDAQKQPLHDAARWRWDVASCSQSGCNNHSLSWQIVTLCLYVWCNDHVHSAGCASCKLNRIIFIFLACLLPRALHNVDQVCLVLSWCGVLKQDTKTILSSCCSAANPDLWPVERSMRKQDFRSGEPYIVSVSHPCVKIAQWFHWQGSFVKGTTETVNASSFANRMH